MAEKDNRPSVDARSGRDPDATYLSAIVELNDKFRDLEDPAEVAYVAAELLGRTLDVSRAGYGTINPELETIDIERDWNAPGIKSLAGTLHFRDYGSYIEDLKRGETVVFADAEKDPRTAANAEALKAISAQSVVNMPIREQGGLVALLYLNHERAREWSEQELRFIRDVAERTRWVVERRRVEGRLRDGEERFRTVFENAAVGMLEIEADWRIRTANAAYAQLVGIAPEELAGMSCLAFTHPDDIEISEKALRDAAARPKGERISFEKRYVREDCTIVWIRSNLAKISGDGSTARFLKVVEDITDTKNAHTKLENQRHTLEILNETGAHLAAQLDTERIVQGVTDAGVELTGAAFGAFFYNLINEAGESLMLYTLSGADRADFERFGHPRATEVFAPTFKGEGVVRSDDITADPRYGKNAPYKGMPKNHLPVRSYLAVPVISRDGDVIGGLFFGHPDVGVFTDDSERLMRGLAGQAAIAIDNARLFESVRRSNQTLEERVEARTRELSEAHEALRQSQKMETVGQLTGGIAHDFNNLLQIVSGNLDLLRQKLPDDASHLKRYADRAFNGADRAATLTQRLLAFSRRQPLAPKAIDINRLIPGMSELLHRTLGETIEVEAVLAPRLWMVEADPNQLENAIINLAINARDAMPEGGKLTIETQNTHLDQSYTTQNPEVSAGQYAVICISDTGVGMDSDTAAKAIEPFFTTKEVGRGTGLGLSMVYGFVKQSGGHLKIYSEPGEGTTIKIYLPRLLGNIDASTDNADQIAIEAQGSETILVCEDDEDVRAYSVEVLRELGYNVLEAADGATALSLLEAKGRVDLLFTDVVLPGGMTGAVLARKASELQPDIKTLFTTGYARNAIVHHGRLDPGVDLLTKPFSYADLAARVRDILDGARSNKNRSRS